MKFELDLAHSRLIDMTLLLAHGFAALMVIVSPLMLLFRLAMPPALILSLIYYLKHNRQRVRIEIDEDNFCLLQIDNATPVECRISTRSFVASYLVILRLECDNGRTKYVVIPPDRLDPHTFRRLRVFLRWRIRFETESGGVKI